MVTQSHTSAQVGPKSPVRAPARRKRPLLLATLLGVATLALAIVTNGNIGATLAPTFAFLFGSLLVRVPLRYTWLGYIFLVLTLDNPAEPFCGGRYKSPFHLLAVALTGQLKNVLPSNALFMSGLDMFLLMSFALHVARRATRSPIDREGYVPVPFPMMVASWGALAAVLIATVYGLATGGSSRFVMWQSQRNIYLPLVFLLAQGLFPSPANWRPLLKMLLFAACLRAVFAILLRQTCPTEEYTSSHSDSELFGLATCWLIARFFHKPTPREVWSGLSMLVLLVGGMIANDRRIVWVELAFAVGVMLWVTPRNRIKVRVAQTILASLPFAIVYIAAGWHSTSSVFKPVATIRSMVDSKSDGSTLWRDIENFNLVTTFSHTNPVLGSGFGHPFEMARALPDVTSTYELEPYVPHNSIAGLWAFTGYVGFTLLWLMPVIGLYFAIRSYYYATDRFDRSASLAGGSLLIVYGLQCYGDMGLGSVVSVLLLAPTLAMIGKTAVKVGAWTV